MKKSARLVCFALASSVSPLQAGAGELSGYVAVEALGFVESPAAGATSMQHDGYVSLSAEPEYYTDWNNGDNSLTFSPFVRIDGHDSERTHFDIRELSWTQVADDWEMRAGIAKVFWGVTEAAHLVDIINQTDLVENGDGEDKLGQPMVDLTLIRDWGIVDVFILPGFRERTFAGDEGRPRSLLTVDTDAAEYESAAEDKRVDFAIRWAHSVGDWDIGIAHFSGTSREPRFRTQLGGPGGMTPVGLVPVYEIIDQTSIDVQASMGGWLWKLEVVSRSGQGERFTAAAGGFEYSLVGIFESNTDLGLIAEYLFDDRGDTPRALQDGLSSASAFQDDLVIGSRWAFNDIDSSEILASVIIDLEGNGYNYSVEASRRFGDNWKLSMEARGVADLPDDYNGVLRSVKDDNRLRAELAYYY
jgi:hypothetical protein